MGIIQPSEENLLRALRFLDDRRVADAEKDLAEAPDKTPTQRVWKALIGGLMIVNHGELARAEPRLLTASTLALAADLGRDDGPDIELKRLAARALAHLGWLYRRSDRCRDARAVHLASFKLREAFGSFEELWESATELALDADVSRRFAEGERWHRKAIEAAQSASEEPLRKQAMAWTDLSTSQEAAGKLEECVASARSARKLWHEHDPGAVTAAQADAKLGRALLKLGEDLSEAEDARAAEVLGEAVRMLAAARDALLAFGSEHATEAQSCGDQQDFASRLGASIGNDSAA